MSVIAALRSMSPNTEDVQALEKLLNWSPLKTDYEVQGSAEQKPLGEFVREIVGLDMNAAKEAFCKYLNDASLDSRQIYFVDVIVEYILSITAWWRTCPFWGFSLRLLCVEVFRLCVGDNEAIERSIPCLLSTYECLMEDQGLKEWMHIEQEAFSETYAHYPDLTYHRMQNNWWQRYGLKLLFHFCVLSILIAWKHLLQIDSIFLQLWQMLSPFYICNLTLFTRISDGISNSWKHRSSLRKVIKDVHMLTEEQKPFPQLTNV